MSGKLKLPADAFKGFSACIGLAILSESIQIMHVRVKTVIRQSRIAEPNSVKNVISG
jgi:hypothetical protein